MTAPASVREVASGLSGYLCGTNYRLRRSRRWAGPDSIATNHRLLIQRHEPDGVRVQLGARTWSPEGGSVRLRDSLLETLRAPGIVDLVVFGSHARGSTTGYSDVDAILVLDDSVADDPNGIRALRRHVLAAQRAALAHQPMQHHGFIVASKRLLSTASDSLGMPAEGVAETVSLFGARSEAWFTPSSDAGRSLRELAAPLRATHAWPQHPWLLHRRLSMFELLPTLYLQATGRPTAKHESFIVAADEFGDSWWPYESLERIRSAWPRTRRSTLEMSARLVGNPWLGIAAWRRLPLRPPSEIVQYLTDECLAGLRGLATTMLERVP